jgi:hypothetical protein
MADKNPGFFDSDEEDDDFVPQGNLMLSKIFNIL